MLLIPDNLIHVPSPASRNGVIALRTTNALAVALTLVLPHVNVVRNILLEHPTWITPATYTFTIWHLIHLLLAGFAIYQLIPSTYEDKLINEGYSWLVSVVLLVNMGWWKSGCVSEPWALWVALLLQFVLLFILSFLYYQQATYGETDWEQRIFVHFPFRIFFGWTLVTVWVNAFVTFGLYPHETGDLLLKILSIIAVVMMGMKALGILAKNRDIVVAFTIVWALTGIALQIHNVFVVHVAAVVMDVIVSVHALAIIASRVWARFRSHFRSEERAPLL